MNGPIYAGEEGPSGCASLGRTGPRLGYIRSPGVLRLSYLSATTTLPPTPTPPPPSPPYGPDIRRPLLRQRAPEDGTPAPSLLYLLCEIEQHQSLT